MKNSKNNFPVFSCYTRKEMPRIFCVYLSFYKPLVFLLLLIISFGQLKSQIIVETFESAAWTTAASFGTNSITVAAGGTGSTATQNIISFSASTTVGVTVTTNAAGSSSTAGGGWTWMYSKASISNLPLAWSTSATNNSSKLNCHSLTSTLRMTSGSYLITPVLPTGVASITFWMAGGSGNAGPQIGINSVNTTFTGYTTGVQGAATNCYSLSSSGSAALSTNTSRVQRTYNATVSNPCRVAFEAAAGLWIDDIVIYPALAGITTGTAGSVNASSAVISGNILNNVSTFATSETGIVFSLSSNPTTADTKVINGTTTNQTFSSNISGLSSSTQYYVRTYAINTNGTFYGNEISFTTTAGITLPEPTNQPTSFATGTITTSNIPLTWTSAVTGTQAPDGYLIKASNTAAPGEQSDASDPANQLSLVSGTANVKVSPQSAAAYSSFTNYTAGTMYYFRINSYTNSGSSIDYLNTASSPTNPGPTVYAATLPNAVTSPAFTTSGTNGSISWTGASGYSNTNHTTLVFIKAASSITVGTPTNAPSTYTDNPALTSGTAYQGDASAHCIYKGDGTAASVTGLSAGVTYYVLILVVVDAANSNSTNSYSAAATINATTPSEYTWDGSTSTDWTVASNWTPDRSSPSSSDILNFNTGTSVSITNFTAATYGSISKLKISNNTNVTINAGSSQTLTITSVNGIDADLEINAGSSLITQASRVNITLGASTTADISGTLTINSGTTYNTDAANAVTTISGTLNCYGTVTSTASARIIVTSGGVYNHAVNGGTVPKATWNTNSKLLISGITTALSVDGLGQHFSKLEYNCPLQNNNVAGESKVFVLGAYSGAAQGDGVGTDTCLISDSLIVRSTGSDTFQITSSGGQRSFTVGAYYQTGGIVAINYNTNGSGNRSLIVNNKFYVDNTTQSPSVFYIINASENVTGKLITKGDLQMVNSTIAKVEGDPGFVTIAQIYFNGISGNQSAIFGTMGGDINFFSNNANGVTLGSNATCKALALNAGVFSLGTTGNTLTINGPITGTATLGGHSTAGITIGRSNTAGTLNFAAGAQVLKNLTLLDTATITLGTTLSLTAGSSFGTLKIDTASVLTTADFLTLRSDANGTARIDSIPVNGSGVALGTISGKITVERYLPMNINWDSRRWRLIGAPVSTTGAPTLKEAWQEGATPTPATTSATSVTSIYNPFPTYGTHITNGAGSTNNGNGFDAGSTNNPSIYKMEPGVGSWSAPSTTGSPITNYGAYMIFVRGDRSIIVSNPYINTTGGANLRVKGNMNVGNVSKSILAGKQVLSNPYASSISLNKVLYNGSAFGADNTKKYYLWDPKLWGSKNVGSWVTFSSNGNNTYLYVPSPIDSGYMSSYGTTGLIESGGAFLINAPASGSLVFHESDKIANSTTVGLASRPVQNRPINSLSILYTNLAYRNAVDDPILADGVATVYADEYYNEVDEQDAEKMATFSSKEKISLLRDGNVLAIEKRKTITLEDTIFLQMDKLDYNYKYQLQFMSKNFAPHLTAYLVDAYLKTRSVISTTDNIVTRYNFETTSENESLDINRFKVVFKLPTSSPLPIFISSININQQANANDVEWNVETQIGVKQYEIEKSMNGVTFTKVAAIMPANINRYNWLDEAAANGTTYYRIKIISQTGQTYYSSIAKITRDSNAPSISVYPNIITNGSITLQFNNTVKGKYDIQLINELGQLLFTKQINHSGDNAVVSIQTGKLAKGIYQLKIISPDSKDKVIKVLY